jgi:hypothetical protein
MQIEYDEKGKMFTEVISKDKVRSHIQTENQHIIGNVHVRVGDRLSDELNKENNFLAITEAEIYATDGQLLYSINFLAVNRKHIVWVMPIDQRPEVQSEGGA